MQDALAETDASITEATGALKSLAKSPTIQVFSTEERDRLKAVAYAWFKTHRPCLQAHLAQPDVQRVDAAYQIVLEATSRNAARNTYKQALLAAKRYLVEARATIASTPASTPPAPTGTATTDAPPSFAPMVADARMQEILTRRWQEVQRCITSQAHLAATVMMGGLLESLLLARINSSPDKPAIFTCKNAPRDRAMNTLPLADWKLVAMVEVAHELTWISKSAAEVGSVLRDFRNYIHPHKEYTDGVALSAEDTHMFWELTKAITRQVLASVGKSP